MTKVDILPSEVYKCDRCPELLACSQQVVTADWLYPDAELPLVMGIGRNPGKTEDKQGVPFIGRAGQLLRPLLPPNIYLTNLVKHYSPDNRPPTPLEIDNCREYVEYEIKTLKPKLVILFGKEAGEAFGFEDKQWGYMRSDGDRLWLMTYHPSHAARGDTEQRQQITEFIKGNIGYAWQLVVENNDSI